MFVLSCVCHIHLCVPGSHSDSVEREATLGDNSVQLQTVVQYEPDLFITRLVSLSLYLSLGLSVSLSLSLIPCISTFLCSDSNLNRYEVHPTRTISEAIGPEFYTHFRVSSAHTIYLFP